MALLDLLIMEEYFWRTCKTFKYDDNNIERIEHTYNFDFTVHPESKYIYGNDRLDKNAGLYEETSFYSSDLKYPSKWKNRSPRRRRKNIYAAPDNPKKSKLTDPRLTRRHQGPSTPPESVSNLQVSTGSNSTDLCSTINVVNEENELQYRNDWLRLLDSRCLGKKDSDSFCKVVIHDHYFFEDYLKKRKPLLRKLPTELKTFSKSTWKQFEKVHDEKKIPSDESRRSSVDSVSSSRKSIQTNYKETDKEIFIPRNLLMQQEDDENSNMSLCTTLSSIRYSPSSWDNTYNETKTPVISGCEFLERCEENGKVKTMPDNFLNSLSLNHLAKEVPVESRVNYEVPVSFNDVINAGTFIPYQSILTYEKSPFESELSYQTETAIPLNQFSENNSGIPSNEEDSSIALERNEIQRIQPLVELNINASSLVSTFKKELCNDDNQKCDDLVVSDCCVPKENDLVQVPLSSINYSPPGLVKIKTENVNSTTEKIKQEPIDPFDNTNTDKTIAIKAVVKREEPQDDIENLLNDSQTFLRLGVAPGRSVTEMLEHNIENYEPIVNEHPKIIYNQPSSGKILSIVSDDEAIIISEDNSKILFHKKDFAPKNRQKIGKTESLRNFIREGQMISFHGARLISQDTSVALYETNLVYEGSIYPSLSFRSGMNVKSSFVEKGLYKFPRRAIVKSLLLPFHALIKVENPSPRTSFCVTTIFINDLFSNKYDQKPVSDWIDDNLYVGEEIFVELKYTERGPENSVVVARGWKFPVEDIAASGPTYSSENENIAFKSKDFWEGNITDIQGKFGVITTKIDCKFFSVYFSEFYKDGIMTACPLTYVLKPNDRLYFKHFRFSQTLNKYWCPYVWKGRKPTILDRAQRFLVRNSADAMTSTSSIYCGMVKNLLPPTHAVVKTTSDNSLDIYVLLSTESLGKKAQNLWIEKLYKVGDLVTFRLKRESDSLFSVIEVL